MFNRLKAQAARIKREIAVYRKAAADPRCPRLAKVFLGAAVAYALSPIDLIPDFIPVIGFLDDVLVVPLLVWLGIRLIPKELLAEIREQQALQSNCSANDRRQK